MGAVALLVVAAFVRKPLPSLARLGDVPWWVWIGGLLGAFYVTGSIVTAPKLGAMTLAAAIVFGQTLASLLLDQFGWVGFEEQHATPGRLLGVCWSQPASCSCAPFESRRQQSRGRARCSRVLRRHSRSADSFFSGERARILAVRAALPA